MIQIAMWDNATVERWQLYGANYFVYSIKHKQYNIRL